MTGSKISWLFVLVTVFWMVSCAESKEADLMDLGTGEYTDTDTNTDADTVTVTVIDTDTDTYWDADSDSDSDADADTGSDAVRDADSDSEADTDTVEDPGAGYTCEDPLIIAPEDGQYNFVSNSSFFGVESFDAGELTNCRDNGDKPVVWFQVTVPAQMFLRVTRKAGIFSWINILESCDATSCLNFGVDKLLWGNWSEEPMTVLVAYEQNVLSDSVNDILFEIYEKQGERCEAGIELSQTHNSQSADFGDYEGTTLPPGCTDGAGTVVWFDVNVPPATKIDFMAKDTLDTVVGYGTSCDAIDACWDSPESFAWTNLSENDVALKSFVRRWSDTATTGQTLVTVNYTPLPPGDVCMNALDVESESYTWNADDSAFEHDCPADICPKTSGADVWHTVDVPSGAVLTVEKTSGSADMYFAAILGSNCSAYGETLYFSKDPEKLIWQNGFDTTQTITVISGGVSAASLNGVELRFAISTPQVGDFCGNARDDIVAVVDGSVVKNGSWSSVGNFFWGGSQCAAADGPEVWYKVPVPAGIKLNIDKLTGGDVAIQVKDQCIADGCVAGSDTQSLGYLNDTSSDVVLFVSIESVSYEASPDDFSVEFSWETPLTGDTCKSAISDVVPLTDGFVIEDVNWSSFNNYFTGEGNCAPAKGAEIWYTIPVASAEKLVISKVSGADIAIQLRESCDDEQCIDGSSSQSLVYLNETLEEKILLVGMESLQEEPEVDHASIKFEWQLAVEGDLCANPQLIPIDVDTWSGMWRSFMDNVTFDSSNQCQIAEGRDAWFSVEVQPFHKLTVSQNSTIRSLLHVVNDCGEESVCLFSEKGNVTWYNDSAEEANIIIGVEAMNSAVSDGPIELTFDRKPISTGDSCSSAIEVFFESSQFTHSPSTWDYGTAWSDSSCDIGATGTDIWYEIEVPADKMLFFEELTSVLDVSLYMTDECPVINDCILGADEPERLVWYNYTGSSQTVYAVVKGKDEWVMSTLSILMSIDDPIEGDFCDNAIQVPDLESQTDNTWSIDSLKFDYSTDGVSGYEGCVEADGPELWFDVDVPAGKWLNVVNASSTPVAIHVVGSCLEKSCVASAGVSVWYQNTDPTAVNLKVVVEALDVVEGDLDLTFRYSDVPPNSVVGSGKLINTHVPMETLWKYSYSQTIYYQEEICAGSIVGISWEVNGSSSLEEEVVIYAGHTTKSSFTSASSDQWIGIGDLTEVFSGHLSAPATKAWVDINFAQPFVYNGVDNLVIAVDVNTGSWFNTPDFFCFTSSANRSLYSYQDSADIDPANIVSTSYSGVTANVPNTKFNY